MAPEALVTVKGGIALIERVVPRAIIMQTAFPGPGYGKSVLSGQKTAYNPEDSFYA